MSEQVTVKSMMLDFAAKLRKDGLESVSLEFFERLANKERKYRPHAEVYSRT